MPAWPVEGNGYCNQKMQMARGVEPLAGHLFTLPSLC